MTWQKLLKLAIKKHAYELEVTAREGLPLLHRLSVCIKYGRLKDPIKGYTAEALAMAYVEAFRKERGGGLKYLDGENSSRTISTVLRYNSNNVLPVYTLTYYDGATAWQTRRAFNKWGGYDEWGVGYPISEIGVTGLPTPLPQDIRKDVEAYEANFRLIQEVLRTADN